MEPIDTRSYSAEDLALLEWIHRSQPRQRCVSCQVESMSGRGKGLEESPFVAMERFKRRKHELMRDAALERERVRYTTHFTPFLPVARAFSHGQFRASESPRSLLLRGRPSAASKRRQWWAGSTTSWPGGRRAVGGSTSARTRRRNQSEGGAQTGRGTRHRRLRARGHAHAGSAMPHLSCREGASSLKRQSEGEACAGRVELANARRPPACWLPKP